MAAVRGRLPAPKPAAEQRRERRILLPSNRVAVFKVPNVGEFLELRADAIRKAEAKAGAATSDAGINLELGKLVLRRCLVGLTAEPVVSVLKPGTDLDAVRAAAEAEGREDVEAIVAATEDAAEDVEATKAAARPLPVSDIVWDEQENAAGVYLARCPECGLDTPEGADWHALNDFAMVVMPAVMRGLDSPKAPGRPRIRSLR